MLLLIAQILNTTKVYNCLHASSFGGTVNMELGMTLNLSIQTLWV